MKKKRQYKKASVIVALGMLMAVCMTVGCKKPAQGELESNKKSAGQAAESEPQKSPDPILAADQLDSETVLITAPEDTPAARSLIVDDGLCIADRIATPEGFTRILEEEGSFGKFVREYPLLPHGSPVLLYNRQEKGNQMDHAAVFAMNILDRDLQQCADSVMRIYGEYFWKQGEYDKIAFHFVSGFLFSYEKWRDGWRVSVDGNQVNWVKKSGYDDSLENFERYLEMLFAYSSTLSMEEESEPAEISDLQIGDVFLKGGSPGHVVMVADICENEAGEKAYLLAQGYMPAQQFHILKNDASKEDPWYYEKEFSWPFRTPEYTFQEGSLRRMRY